MAARDVTVTTPIGRSPLWKRPVVDATQARKQNEAGGVGGGNVRRRTQKVSDAAKPHSLHRLVRCSRPPEKESRDKC